MGFMTITTQSPDRNCHSCTWRTARAGFTLVEVLISAGIASFVLAGILTAFLFLGRSGANISNYSEMEAQARRGLEQFGQDARQASAITWNSAINITLTVNTDEVTYAYDAATESFTRQLGSGDVEPLISGISDASNFEFRAYKITGVEIDLSDLSTAALRASAGSETKQLQISLSASRTSRTVAGATNTVLSARYVLRNKRITT